MSAGFARACTVMWAAAACGGADRAPATGETGVTTPMSDTVVEESPYFRVRGIYFAAELAFNGVRQLTAEIEGSAAPPVILITLASEEWDGTGADIENYCLIGVPLVQATRRTDLGRSSLKFGFSWEPELDPVLSTCNTEGYQLDPRVWGSDPIGFFTTGVDHFVAVGEQTSLVADFLRTNAPDLDLVGGALGLPGGFTVNNVDKGRTDDAYTFAYAMDPSGRLVVENGELVVLAADDLRQDWLRPAYYYVSSLYYWAVP